MYKRILFSTCMTEYCEHTFTFALNMAKENNAKLWIYHGLGRLNLSEDETNKKIAAAEARVKETYRDKLKEFLTSLRFSERCSTCPSFHTCQGGCYTRRDYSMDNMDYWCPFT